jgi:hypothetical protein
VAPRILRAKSLVGSVGSSGVASVHLRVQEASTVLLRPAICRDESRDATAKISKILAVRPMLRSNLPQVSAGPPGGPDQPRTPAAVQVRAADQYHGALCDAD